MPLTDEQRIQLRATALEKASRLVAVVQVHGSDMYAVSENMYHYMLTGIIPTKWDVYDPFEFADFGGTDD